MQIYQAPIVKSIQAFYGDLLKPNSAHTIYQHMNLLSVKMFEGLKQEEKCLYTQLNNYNPDFLGHPIASLKNRSYDLEDCRKTISHEYGFNSWTEVMELENSTYYLEFEQCVDAIVRGDIGLLTHKIKENPSVIKTHSQYGHKATLLHYTASNGIELWRQQVPSNLIEITQLLIQNGADRNAKMKVYNGFHTTLELLTTSAHPYAAGIGEIIAEILKD